MDVRISTKSELEQRCKEVEAEFNTVRDELAAYIESTKTKIEELTKRMDKLHDEYMEITNEMDKRDGKSNSAR
ncbi:MAG: hypothetical protein J6X18_10835 [Bacteroidales bacterium]|nr:hypothetical protein [Bacteroidales bacterium]